MKLFGSVGDGYDGGGCFIKKVGGSGRSNVFDCFLSLTSMTHVTKQIKSNLKRTQSCSDVSQEWTKTEASVVADCTLQRSE